MQRLITEETVRRALPKRQADSNKGSYGAVLVAAGCLAYRGAAALCCEGALRGGAGLVYLAGIEPVVQLVLARTPECCVCGCRTDANGGIHAKDATALRGWFAGKDTVLVAGPGLGENAAAVTTALLAKEAPWRAAVLDADALNALAAGAVRASLPATAVLTPHPGEAARLLNRPVAEIQADREGAALDLAATYGCVAVLKGSGTLVAAPDGTVWRNETGNPGLAKGGSGDVLAGLTGALLAQGLPAAQAAATAVWLHGTAADRCAKRLGQISMLPQDLFADLCALLAELGR